MTSENYEIKKKRSGRYYIRTRGGKTVNGDEKTKILLDAGLIKAVMPKKEEAPVEEAPAEAPVEEAKAEEAKAEEKSE